MSAGRRRQRRAAARLQPTTPHRARSTSAQASRPWGRTPSVVDVGGERRPSGHRRRRSRCPQRCAQPRSEVDVIVERGRMPFVPSLTSAASGAGGRQARGPVAVTDGTSPRPSPGWVCAASTRLGLTRVGPGTEGTRERWTPLTSRTTRRPASWASSVSRRTRSGSVPGGEAARDRQHGGSGASAAISSTMRSHTESRRCRAGLVEQGRPPPASTTATDRRVGQATRRGGAARRASEGRWRRLPSRRRRPVRPRRPGGPSPSAPKRR